MIELISGAELTLPNRIEIKFPNSKYKPTLIILIDEEGKIKDSGFSIEYLDQFKNDIKEKTK